MACGICMSLEFGRLLGGELIVVALLHGTAGRQEDKFTPENRGMASEHATHAQNFGTQPRRGTGSGVRDHNLDRRLSFPPFTRYSAFTLRRSICWQ